MKEHNAQAIDVLLIQRSSTDFYPAVINQANLLSEAGLNVTLVDGGAGPRISMLHPGVSLLRPLKMHNLKSKGFLARALVNIKFVRFVRKIQKSVRVACIAYDHAAIIASLPPHKLPSLSIHHYHDHPELQGLKIEPQGLQYLCALRKSKKADLIVVADRGRKEMVFRQTNINKDKIMAVRNCPRVVAKTPEGKLRSSLIERGIHVKKIVLYQGAIAESYYASNVVRSIKDWPEDTVLVLLGRVKEEFKKNLMELANALGVQERIVFIAAVPYEQLFQFTVDADVGIGLQKPVDSNFKFAAGACNKRYEYMACGIPQIANLTPDIKGLIDETNAGLCVFPENPSDIAAGITALIKDPEGARRMGKAGRQAHLEKFNYEKEFEPVLNLILDYAGRKLRCQKS